MFKLILAMKILRALLLVIAVAEFTSCDKQPADTQKVRELESELARLKQNLQAGPSEKEVLEAGKGLAANTLGSSGKLVQKNVERRQ